MKLFLHSAKCQILLLLLLAPAQATYQLKITNRQYLNGGTNVVLDPIADSLETKFNSILASSDNTGFVTQVSNANAGSTRGYIAPGVSGEARYSGAFGLSGAYSGWRKPSVPANSLPSVGVAAQSGISLSANGEYVKIFQGLDPKRVLYHLSFYTMDLSSYFSSGITVDSLQFSAGLSYLLDHPKEWIPGVRFSGIRVTSGLSYGSFNGSYTTPFTISSGGIDMKSNATLSVDSKVYTFTNQATAGLRFFYLLDLYLGMGVDFNFGSTTLSGTNSNGGVSATQGGVQLFSGDANVTGTPDSGSPSVVDFRWIAGTQVNLGPLGVYAQFQISTPTVYSLNLGAKIEF